MVGRAELIDAAARAIKTRSGYYRSHCPFCEAQDGVAQKKRNFTIRMTTGDFWCWKCQEKGYISNLSEALFADVEAAKAEKASEILLNDGDFEPPEGFRPLGSGYGATSNRYRDARHYLASRGVWHGILEECQIGAVLERKSVVVPILDNGRWRGYVSRRWDRKGYLYPPGMARGELMFNMDELYRDTAEPLMLVEGVFDALPHFPRAVACLGKPSMNHYAMLRKVARPLAIVLDADAQREGWSLATMLQMDGVNSRFVKLPPGSDPGELCPDSLWEAVLGAWKK